MSIEVPQLHGSQVPGEVTNRELDFSRKLGPIIYAAAGLVIIIMLGTLFVEKLPFSTGGHF